MKDNNTPNLINGNNPDYNDSPELITHEKLKLKS
jgi:hypothetical protein